MRNLLVYKIIGTSLLIYRDQTLPPEHGSVHATKVHLCGFTETKICVLSIPESSTDAICGRLLVSRDQSILCASVYVTKVQGFRFTLVKSYVLYNYFVIFVIQFRSFTALLIQERLSTKMSVQQFICVCIHFFCWQNTFLLSTTFITRIHVFKIFVA